MHRKLNFIRLLTIIIMLLPSNTFNSECNDSLGGHNLWEALARVWGPDPPGGGALPQTQLATGQCQGDG